MNIVYATSIGIHVATGVKHTYDRDGLSLVANIFDDSDVDIFNRNGLIYDGAKILTEFSGDDVIGLTVMAKCPYDFFFERERLLGILVKEIDCQTAIPDVLSERNNDRDRRRQNVTMVEERREKIFSQLVFVGGMTLYLEFSQLVEQGISEVMVLNHIFSHPSLTCRRVEGGLSIWNTSRITSWTNFSRREVQPDSSAEEAKFEVSESLSNSVPVLKLHSSRLDH